MILYNTNGGLNNFGFDDISQVSHMKTRNFKRATPCSRKHSKTKLSAKNITFLKSLGLKVKRSKKWIF